MANEAEHHIIFCVVPLCSYFAASIPSSCKESNIKRNHKIYIDKGQAYRWSKISIF